MGRFVPPIMAPQYNLIRTTASVAYQFSEADADTLVQLLTGRRARAVDGTPGQSVTFALEGVTYEATYRVTGEWWDRKAGKAWGTRMAGIEDVHVARVDAADGS